MLSSVSHSIFVLHSLIPTRCQDFCIAINYFQVYFESLPCVNMTYIIFNGNTNRNADDENIQMKTAHSLCLCLSFSRAFHCFASCFCMCVCIFLRSANAVKCGSGHSNVDSVFLFNKLWKSTHSVRIRLFYTIIPFRFDGFSSSCAGECALFRYSNG